MARSVLLGSLLITHLCAAGCSSPPAPTFHRGNMEDAVRELGEKDYGLDVRARIVGSTLWVYMPLDSVLEEATAPKKSQPQPKPKLFSIKENTVEMLQNIMRVTYAIEPPSEDLSGPGMQYNKGSSEKINKLWRLMRRIVFSMHPEKAGIKFICMVVADIAQGYYINDIVFTDDLKKVSYDFISLEEFQHRIVQDVYRSDALIGDKEGANVYYRDISMPEFITGQIHDRIQLKFGKPEVEKNADVDKEILKTVGYTLRVYQYYDFETLELVDPRSGRKLTLSPAALRSHTRQ